MREGKGAPGQSARNPGHRFSRYCPCNKRKSPWFGSGGAAKRPSGCPRPCRDSATSWPREKERGGGSESRKREGEGVRREIRGGSQEWDGMDRVRGSKGRVTSSASIWNRVIALRSARCSAYPLLASLMGISSEWKKGLWETVSGCDGWAKRVS